MKRRNYLQAISSSSELSMIDTTDRAVTVPHQGLIRVGVDGSGPSEAALCWAARQVRLTGARLLTVLVWEYPASLGWAPPFPPAFDPERDARNALAATVDKAFGADRRVETEPLVVEGRSAPELLEAGSRPAGRRLSRTQRINRHAAWLGELAVSQP